MYRIYLLIFSVAANLSRHEIFSVAKTMRKNIDIKNWDNFDKIMSSSFRNPSQITSLFVSNYGDHSYLLGVEMRNS